MSSWILCPCGNQIHKNLFAGANVSVVVVDDVLDSIEDHASARDAINKIVLSGDILVRCKKCGRVAIEETKTGAITIYAKDTLAS
jgi:hypothetical protein